MILCHIRKIGTGRQWKRLHPQEDRYKKWAVLYLLGGPRYGGHGPITGKQVQRTITGKTQQEVAQRAREIAVEVDQKTYKAPCKLTVGEWLELWKREYTGDVKPSTAYLYGRNIDQYIIPHLGAVKLETLTPLQVQELYNRLTEARQRRGTAFICKDRP